MLAAPNDAEARTLLAATGVPLAPASLLPLRGVLYITRTLQGAYAYRWRD